MTTALKELFTTFPELRDDLDNFQFDKIYGYLNAKDRGEFTALMLENGINPLLCVDQMPSRYAWQAPIHQLDIPANIKTISSNAFANCSELQTASIPEHITEVAWRAFYHCDDLESIYFNKTLIEIPSECCKQCLNLQSVDVGESCKNIGDHAFAYCHKLANVHLSTKVETINEYAFYQCDKLRKIELPATLEYIGPHAFTDCALCDKAVSSIHYAGTKKMWDQIDIADSAFGYKSVMIDSADGVLHY